jgi:hypothetical protein
VAALACERPEYEYSDDVPIVGTGNTSFGGSFSFAGSVGVGGSAAVNPCALDRVASLSPVYSKQAISNQLPARPEVYMQLTDDEAEDLKQTRTLVPKAGTPPFTPLMSTLNQLLLSASTLRKPLIQELIKRFKFTRPTWPNPWALRLAEHPGSEHMNPVRIKFKKDAWIVRLVDGSPVVVDVNNAVVSIDAATGSPERIAAVFYVVDDRPPGNAASCETGKRELALGNEAMVEEFELGSQAILARIDQDIAALEALFKIARPCQTVDKMGLTFHAQTVCQAWDFFDATTEYSAYQWSLSNPVELYKPTSQNLANLVAALKGDRFEPDPFVSEPNPVPDPIPMMPNMGDGGAGGEGGYGGEGGVSLGGVGGALD